MPFMTPCFLFFVVHLNRSLHNTVIHIISYCTYKPKSLVEDSTKKNLRNYENRLPNESVQNARQAEVLKVNLSLHHFSVHTYLSLCTITDN